MNSNLHIPIKWEKRLKETTREIVYKNISAFSNILENDLCFFPEYTNHKLQHFNNILDISEKIVGQSANSCITEYDVMAYVLSALYHDLGMHISYDGFIRIIKKGALDHQYAYLYSDISWNQLWDKYVLETRLWNEDKRNQILGSLSCFDKMHMVVNAREKFPEYAELNLYDRLFIGEFIRKNHCRLAFDIVIKGFPLTDSNLEIIPNEWKLLIGHIVRSHGENIWYMQDLIKKEYGEVFRFVNEIHVLYLMIVLRIADYFDISEKRAAINIFRLQHFSSQISVREWKINQCVKGIRFNVTNDPEVVFIETTPPEDSRTFLSLKYLLENMQKELDTSWAVLGDTYGNQKDEKKLILSVRRIKTDLLNVNKAAHCVPYLTEPVSFRTNPSILKLLVAPLYNYEPAYGIRELLQNAIDACKEKDVMSKLKGEKYEGKIKIKFSKKNNMEGNITVVDNGIGMTKNVITNYYLVAGGSFRNDPMWKNQFMDIETKESTVNRNGRFGIGVLSAFMLGNKVSVETVSYIEKTKYRFDAILEAVQLDIYKENAYSQESGTKVTIQVPMRTMNLITNLPDWFCEDTPEIIFDPPSIMSNKWQKIEYKNWIPYKLSTGNHIRFYWYRQKLFRENRTYFPQSATGLYVNGLLVEETETDVSVNVIEKNEEISLSLRRDRLLFINGKRISSLDIIREIKEGLSLPYLYMCDPFKFNRPWSFCDNEINMENTLLYSKNGYFLLKNIQKVGAKDIVYINSVSGNKNEIEELKKILKSSEQIIEDVYFVKGLIRDAMHYGEGNMEIPNEIIISNVRLSLCALIVPEDYFGVEYPSTYFVKKIIGSLSTFSSLPLKRISNEPGKMYIENKWKGYRGLKYLEKIWKNHNVNIVALYHPEINDENAWMREKKRDFYNHEKEIIPYNFNERKKKFPDIFKKYMQWEEYFKEL